MYVRLLLLVIATCGGAEIALEPHTYSPGFPLPGPGLSVRVPVEVRTSGEYIVELMMPRATADIHVVDETLPCDLSFKVEKEGVFELRQQVNAVSSTSEFGWARIVRYQAGTAFHLGRGDHFVEVVRGTTCPAAVSRGAAVTVGEDLTYQTERYLLSQLLFLSARLALFGSLATLIFLEIRRRPNNRWRGP